MPIHQTSVQNEILDFPLTEQEKRVLAEYSISPVPALVSSTHSQESWRELLWTATVTPSCCNRHDTLHGGIGATWLTFLTLVHAKRFVKTSPSSGAVDFETISYNTSLLKAVPKNTSCWIQTKIEKSGKQITFTSAKLFTDAACTQLAITAEHVLRKGVAIDSHAPHQAKL